jgi:hypothetical protein
LLPHNKPNTSSNSNSSSNLEEEDEQVEEEELKLEGQMTFALTYRAHGRTETCIISRPVKNMTLSDPTGRLRGSQLLAYFREHYTTRTIERKGGYLSIYDED